MNICICGGGNLGHVVAGFMSSQQINVNLLTSHPNSWSRDLETILPDGTILYGNLAKISDSPKDVIPKSDIILICLPGQYIRDEILLIKDYLSPNAAVGSIVSSTGFFFHAHELIPQQCLFGFQRVPFISRVEEYGKRSYLLGFKEALNVCIENSKNKNKLKEDLQTLLKTPIRLLDTFYEVTFSNSNPLLHPSRIYSMWKNWEVGVEYDILPKFYEEWTDEASILYIEMDEELQKLLRKLNVPETSIPPVLQYYESTDASSLTRKIRSIEAFKPILSPMIKQKYGKYVPDFNSRYFTEDFNLGLKFIRDTAHTHKIHSPNIDKVYEWYEKIISTL